MNGGQPWPDEDAARARALWDEGHGFAAIAREVGRSPNSIAGLCHRRGWPARTAGGAAGPAKLKRLSRPPRPPKATLAAVAVPEPPPAPPPPREPVERRGCMYPRGSRPDWNWCGAVTSGCGPYCAAHRAIAYLRPGTRAWMQERAETVA
jgi:hypothetical protein